jgi:hypothetical protein
VPPVEPRDDDAMACELADAQGQLLAETLLRVLRPFERGAIPMLARASDLLRRSSRS